MQTHCQSYMYILIGDIRCMSLCCQRISSTTPTQPDCVLNVYDKIMWPVSTSVLWSTFSTANCMWRVERGAEGRKREPESRGTRVLCNVLCNIHGNSPSGLRPRARACIFHKTLGLMLYLLHRNYNLNVAWTVFVHYVLMRLNNHDQNSETAHYSKHRVQMAIMHKPIETKDCSLYIWDNVSTLWVITGVHLRDAIKYMNTLLTNIGYTTTTSSVNTILRVGCNLFVPDILSLKSTAWVVIEYVSIVNRLHFLGWEWWLLDNCHMLIQ